MHQQYTQICLAAFGRIAVAPEGERHQAHFDNPAHSTSVANAGRACGDQRTQLESLAWQKQWQTPFVSAKRALALKPSPRISRMSPRHTNLVPLVRALL